MYILYDFIENAVERYACISLWEEKYGHDFVEIVFNDTVLETVFLEGNIRSSEQKL